MRFPESLATYPEVRAIVLIAARFWRSAREADRAAQPCLSALLRPYHCEMLAQCFDSLLSLTETALARDFVVADSGSLSDDEDLLLNLLMGASSSRADLGCPQGLHRALDRALCSTRILLALAEAEAPSRARPR